MSVLIKYTDIAIGAKQAFDLTAGSYLPASNVALIKTDDVKFERYDILLDLNAMILDGNSNFLPEDDLAQVGFISQEISNEACEFNNGISLIFEADEVYTSNGIGLYFDEKKNIYATDLNIKWYNNDNLLDEMNYYPQSAYYFCNRKVEFYNKLIITINKINVPYNRFVLNGVDYGIKVEFGENELKSAKIIQEIDPISTSIPISPFDFTIVSKKNIEFSFQSKQPIEVYFNDKLKATTFVKNAKRKSSNVWEINSEDYIGLLDTIYFTGGMYSNKSAKALFQEIFDVAKTPYSITEDFVDMNLTGYIPYTTCREALMQVCFATQTIATTKNSDKINIVKLSNDVKKNVPLSRIMQGQNFQEETRVTAVELTSHAYTKTEQSATIYDASQSGIGDNIFVIFTQPFYDLSITNGTIIEQGVNYAVINANNESCLLIGKKYEHTTAVHKEKNPLVLTSDIENIIAIENATLVSSSNVDNILQMCYNYLVNTETTSMKIVDGRKEEYSSVGDVIAFETEYLGIKLGRITKQSFGLDGGVLVKNSIIRNLL